MLVAKQHMYGAKQNISHCMSKDGTLTEIWWLTRTRMGWHSRIPNIPTRRWETMTEYRSPIHMHAMGTELRWDTMSQYSSSTHACHGVNRHTKNCISKRWDTVTEYPLKTAPVHMHAMGSTDTQRTACLKDVTSWQNAAKRWVILAAKQLTYMQEIILIQSRTCTKTEYPLKTTPVHMHAMGSTDTQRTAYLKDGTPRQNTHSKQLPYTCMPWGQQTHCLSKRWDTKTEYQLPYTCMPWGQQIHKELPV